MLLIRSKSAAGGVVSEMPRMRWSPAPRSEKKPSRYASKHPSGDAFRVPENHVFAMGDNRGKSLDSRSWGSVPIDVVKGKALVIYWSTDPDGAIPWWKVHRKIRFRRIGRRVKSQYGDVDPDRLRDPDE